MTLKMDPSIPGCAMLFAYNRRPVALPGNDRVRGYRYNRLRGFNRAHSQTHAPT